MFGWELSNMGDFSQFIDQVCSTFQSDLLFFLIKPGSSPRGRVNLHMRNGVRSIDHGELSFLSGEVWGGTVWLEYIMDQFLPSVLDIIKLFLESLQSYFVCYFCFPIGLRVYHKYKIHFHSQISIKVSDHSTCKLSSIIKDDSSGKSTSTHNFFPIEIMNYLSCDFSKKFHLYQFGEIINSYY